MGCIEPKDKEILATDISKKRNISTTKRFLSHVVNEYGKHQVSSDGGGAWHPQAYRFLKLVQHLHSHFEKRFIERTIQYIKDRLKGLMTALLHDYFFRHLLTFCRLMYNENS